jgi:hypothetical protein
MGMQVHYQQSEELTDSPAHRLAVSSLHDAQPRSATVRPHTAGLALIAASFLLPLHDLSHEGCSRPHPFIIQPSEAVPKSEVASK